MQDGEGLSLAGVVVGIVHDCCSLRAMGVVGIEWSVCRDVCFRAAATSSGVGRM